MPSTPPYNLASHVVNATAIFLTWSPPQVPNGIIVSYEVSYQMTGQLMTFQLGNILEYLASNLEAYTLYTFRISAFTRIGQGPSTSLSVRTDIAGMHNIICISIYSVYISHCIHRAIWSSTKCSVYCQW